MFKLSQSDSYSWPVKIMLAADGGRFVAQTFDAVFKRLSQSKIREMVQADEASDAAVSKQVLIGWKGITDDSNSEVPFSEEGRDKLLDIPAVAAAVVEAYLISASGKGPKTKNL